MKTKLRNMLAMWWNSRLGKIYAKESLEWRKAKKVFYDWQDWVLLKERKIHCSDKDYLSIVSQSGQVFRSLRYAVALAELRSRGVWWLTFLLGISGGLIVGKLLALLP